LPNLRGTHARVENMGGQFDVITSRAFATLADFVALSRERLAPGGVWMAMKARTVEQEKADLGAAADVFHVEPLAVPGLDETRCLAWMRLRTG
jgi:16S rRNA (guanine527-N7)-methyltransferase